LLGVSAVKQSKECLAQGWQRQGKALEASPADWQVIADSVAGCHGEIPDHCVGIAVFFVFTALCDTSAMRAGGVIGECCSRPK
jgi:hypothetical protein